jgi:hypothetical protein
MSKIEFMPAIHNAIERAAPPGSCAQRQAEAVALTLG